MRTSMQRVRLGLMGLFLVLAVLAALSARLGGPVSWQLTTGSSMLPGISAGTLVVVHRQHTYEVGDVISYRSKVLRKIVLHRVADVAADGRLVMKGDNNDFLDPEKPVAADVLGKRVFQIQGVGGPVRLLRQPTYLAMGAAAVALLVFATDSRRRRRRTSSAALPSGVATSGSTAGAAAGSAARWGALACLSVALLSSAGPLVHDLPSGQNADRSLAWSYGGTAEPGFVYPGGEVRTGDVLYVRLVDAVDLTASLALTLPDDAEVSGTWHLEVSVENDDGWTRTTTRGTQTPVTERVQSLTTRLAVKDLLALTQTVEAESGAPVGGVLLTAKAVLDVTVVSDGDTERIQDTSLLSFNADDARVMLDPTTPLEQQTGLQVGGASGDERVGVAGLTLPQSPVRTAALVGVAVLLPLLGAARLRHRDEDEDARIRRTAGHLIVNADPAEDPEQIVDVSTFAALRQIAEQYERVLMCGDHAGIPFYYVIDDGIAYRYYSERAAELLDAQAQAADDETPGAAEVEPVFTVPAQRLPGDGVPGPRERQGTT